MSCRNFFEEEEEELVRLRKEQEGEARKSLMLQIERLEKEAADSQVRLMKSHLGRVIARQHAYWLAVLRQMAVKQILGRLSAYLHRESYDKTSH